jgi:tRNA (guanine-N7-)-methyltransferase
MGRRILPKLDPAINFSRHLSELSELGGDFRLPDLFPRRLPTEVEVGSGKGLFLLNQSGCHPERNYLGIEISKKYARYAAYRFAEAERENARMIRGDAQKFFALHLPENSQTHRRGMILSMATMTQARLVLFGWILHTGTVRTFRAS